MNDPKEGIFAMTASKPRKLLLCAAACLLLLIGFAAPCLADSAETVTVRVGFFAFDGYHEQDADGLRSVYGYELLQHLAGYGGLRYEYVGYDKSWGEMQDMLARGEIDLLTSAQKTPEREARFDFSATNIGVSAAILTVKAGDSTYMESDYANWSGIRVGMIEGNSRNDSFAAFAKEHGFAFVPVYFDSTDDMVNALQSGGEERAIDAIVTSNLRKIRNEWILAQFDSSPFFVMVQKGDDALLDRVNEAIDQMDVCEPGLRTELMNKYYSPENGDAIAFTAEERAFIERMRGTELTALINPDRAPYSYYQDGALSGIAYEAAQEIIARTGLNIRFLKVESPAAYLAAVDAGEADIRFEIANSFNRAEAEGEWLTNAFITVPMARLYRETTTVFQTAAEPMNRDIADNYEALLLNMGFAPTYYESIAQTVDAVLSGERDMSYLAIDTATMAIRNDVTNRLVCEELFGLDTSYAVAVNSDESPLLFSILSKATASIGEPEINAIRQRYAVNLEKPFTVIGFFYDYPLYVLLAAVIALGVVILVVVLVSQSKRRRSEHAHLETEQRQNELLRDALAAAEKAGAAKSQFLSRVSHEMRTPLNAIIGFIELAKTADAERTADYLASSDIAAKQLLSVINDVLDMSSIESGKMKIAMSSFNFRHLISSITNIYGTQCKQKGVGFETRITTPMDDWLVGDELRVNQILMNLLGNAVKFTSEGHIWLTVSETAAEDDRAFVRFTVADTGCGMSEQMLERLFKPFEQESAGTAKRYGGSGLGLSIVKNLVTLMGGTIRVESKQGEGTTFIVDLPFRKSDLERSAPAAHSMNALRVLLVDDEEVERDYMSLVLARIGVRYSCVGSGEDAIAALAQSDREDDLYNVCLIDWMMPGLNGVETTNRIRAQYGKDVVVIVVSAYDFQLANESAKQAGANLFLSKPVFQSALFDLFMTLTGGRIASTKEEPQAWDFAGKRVLLAEDNALNQIVAKGYLARYNVVVDLAADGQAAVDRFTSSAPDYYDAILMDIQMPLMDGYEATRAIRESAHPQAKSIQIIAQTADAFNEDIAKALSAGMDAHVSKPIRPEVLAKALHRAFTRPD